jgi:hypothetical protein
MYSAVAPSAVAPSAVASSDASAIVTKPSVSDAFTEFTRSWIMKSFKDTLAQKILWNNAIDPFACLDMISELISEERSQQMQIQMQMQMQMQMQDQGPYEFQQMPNGATIVSSLKEPVLTASNTIAPLDIKSLKKDESSNEEKSSSRKEEDSSNNENKSSSWAAVASVVTTVPQPAPSPSGSSLSSVKSAKSVTSAASSSNSGNSSTYVNSFVDKVIDDDVEEGTILGFNKNSNSGFYEIDSINMFFKSVRQNTDLTYETLILYLTIINMPNEYREREGKLGGGIHYSNTELFKTKVLPAYTQNKIKVHDFDEDHEYYPCIKEYIDRIIIKENGFYLKKKNAKLFITSKFLSLLKDHLIYE